MNYRLRLRVFFWECFECFRVRNFFICFRARAIAMRKKANKPDDLYYFVVRWINPAGMNLYLFPLALVLPVSLLPSQPVTRQPDFSPENPRTPFPFSGCHMWKGLSNTRERRENHSAFPGKDIHFAVRAGYTERECEGKNTNKQKGGKKTKKGR